MHLKVKRLKPSAKLPTKAHPSDAGFDIYANVDLDIPSGMTRLVSTGIAIEIPEGYYGRLKGRSGLTSKTLLRVQEGTIDSNYRGEIKVICDSLDTELSDVGYMVAKGERIAQLIIQPLPKFEVVEVIDLSDSDRGENGFGSSGV